MESEENVKVYKKGEIANTQVADEVGSFPREFYQVLKKSDPRLREVILYEELLKGYAKRKQKLCVMDIETTAGLEVFIDIKKELILGEDVPVKIEAEGGIFYYISPHNQKGIVFVDEADSQKLFFDLETTYSNVKEIENSNKRR